MSCIDLNDDFEDVDEKSNIAQTVVKNPKQKIQFARVGNVDVNSSDDLDDNNWSDGSQDEGEDDTGDEEDMGDDDDDDDDDDEEEDDDNATLVSLFKNGEFDNAGLACSYTCHQTPEAAP